VIAAAFVSGFCIMAIEMLGARIMSPYFGGSLSVWGSVLTVFMLALSCGYLIGGRLSEGQPELKTYAFFFIVAAVASLPIVFFADGIMRPIFMAIEDPRYGSLIASVFLFFMPTTILGMISPYSIRLLVEHEDHSGKIAGQLFFVSTFGSALGTLGTAFYFVLWFDVNEILSGTMMALMIVGVAIFTLDVTARRPQ
tara:strand:- start:1336 stop:1923 length:588 start_codon:yes stop_codon:yes gene_type:complete